MIAGFFHQGSGLGDQLMRYITVRTLAEEKGYEWGMANPESFKGASFMNSNLGFSPPSGDIFEYTFNEKEVRENGIDIRSYDPEINFIKDNTIIDGSFEDEKYWGHNLDNIRKWLAVEPLFMRNDLCVIGFRGGEYATVPELFLPKDYWMNAILAMKMLSKKGNNLRFEVHTDDPMTAQSVLGDILPKDTPFIHDIGLNWRSVRYAKYLIIANSAFYIMPSLLNEDAKHIIAPRYWARRNTKTWARPACYYKDKRIMYI